MQIVISPDVHNPHSGVGIKCYSQNNFQMYAFFHNFQSYWTCPSKLEVGSQVSSCGPYPFHIAFPTFAPERALFFATLLLLDDITDGRRGVPGSVTSQPWASGLELLHALLGILSAGRGKGGPQGVVFVEGVERAQRTHAHTRAQTYSHTRARAHAQAFFAVFRSVLYTHPCL